MCDTMVATPAASRKGYMIMGKNSDREPNEAQNITFVPASDHKKGSMVKCTYIQVPQVGHTYALLLSRPFWMYGAEMGVNENGVAIGNEAVFTRERYNKRNNSLIGMDILRLALERSKSAGDALGIMIELLERHGQGGNCGMDGKLFYHNSFIIADPMESYIFETSGKHWVYKKVDGIATISNCLVIEDDYDKCSEGLEEYALTRGYTKKNQKLNFSKDFSDLIYTHFARGRIRKGCSYGLLSKLRGAITPQDMMGILRNHNMEEPYQPGKGPMKRICLHAGGLIYSQTTGSMVVTLKKGKPPLIYLTGTSSPCLNFFKPHTLLKGQKKISFNEYTEMKDNGDVDLYGSATNKYSKKTVWWMGEDIHRHVILSYPLYAPVVQEKRNKIESAIVKKAEKAWENKSGKILLKVFDDINTQLINETGVLADNAKNIFNAKEIKAKWWFKRQWDRFNKTAGYKL